MNIQSMLTIHTTAVIRAAHCTTKGRHPQMTPLLDVVQAYETRSRRSVALSRRLSRPAGCRGWRSSRRGDA